MGVFVCGGEIHPWSAVSELVIAGDWSSDVLL